MKASLRPPSTALPSASTSNVATSCRTSPHQAWVHSQHPHLPSRRLATAFPRGHGRPARDCRMCSFPMRPPQLDTEAEVAVVYDRLRVLRSRLDAAVASEDYASAAKLRDDSKAALALLQPAQQYVFHQLDIAKSSNSSTEEKLKAIASIGQVADEYVVAELAVLLQDEALQDAAAAAMWDVFLRWRDPKVVEMMSEGCRLMNNPARYEHALQIFNQLIMLAPSYVESRNKRATVLYQMGRYQESVDDCEVVLDMQPYHFGAASGMGLCYLQMGKSALALEAFERALKIHPGMRNIRFVAEKLREEA